MNCNHSGTGATAPIPSDGGPALTAADVSDAIDGATTNAMGLIDLARWLAEARQTLDVLAVVAAHEPAVDARLRNAGIFVGDLAWDVNETFGLQRLHLCIRDELRTARATVGLERGPR